MKLQILFLILVSYGVNGQIIEKTRSDIAKIQTIEQANTYLADHSALTGQVFEINSRTDSTDFDKELISSSVGSLIDFESEDKKKYFFFKKLETHQIRSFRVQYIFLDNTKITIEQIDSLRSLILKRVNNGESFGKLAKEYSMDGNSKKEGDLGWFEEGMMRKEFEDGIRSKKIGEVFKVDVPSKKWYYIVRNSHAPRFDNKVTILYIVIESGS